MPTRLHRETGTDPTVAISMDLAHRAARAIAWQFGLSPSERADVEQDLITELIARAPLFDAARAAWPAFCTVILRHAASDIIRKIRSRHLRHGGSLQDAGPPSGERASPWEQRVREDEGLAATWAGWVDAFHRTEMEVDLGRFVAALPADLQSIALLLCEWPPGEAQRRSGRSSKTFYRKVREIRMQMLIAGLGTPR